MAIFTDTEIENIREIVRYRSNQLADLQERLTELSEAGATATRADISAWNKIKFGTTAVLGGFKGTDFSIERDRTLITNRVRQRLNIPEVAGELGKNDIGFFSSSVTQWWD